jgi:hypothetical protein
MQRRLDSSAAPVEGGPMLERALYMAGDRLAY